MTTSRFWPCTALLVCGLSACSRSPPSLPPLPLSKAAIAVRDAPPERHFRGTLAGQQIELIAHDCKVFRVEHGAPQVITLHQLVAPEPYPFFTVCDRQSLRYEDGAVVAVLGRMAFGAGGCCASGGTWRSEDGQTWKEQ